MGKGKRKIKPAKRNPIARVLASRHFRQRRREDKRAKILNHWLNDSAKQGLFDG